MEKSLPFPLAERLFREPRSRSQPKPRERVRATPGPRREPREGLLPDPKAPFFFPVLTCLVRLPQHRPQPFPTPSKTQVRERAGQARAQRRRAAGRSSGVAAAILGLRRAAEAGTTRATPSVGVAGDRVGEDDSAEAHRSCQAWIQVLGRTSPDYGKLKNERSQREITKRARRWFDVATPLLRVARRVAAPEVTASAGASGLAPYRCPWSCCACHRAAGGFGDPGAPRRDGAGGRVLGKAGSPSGDRPFRAARSTPFTRASLGTTRWPRPLGTGEGTRGSGSEPTAGDVAPIQKPRTYAQTQTSASSPSFTLLNRKHALTHWPFKNMTVCLVSSLCMSRSQGSHCPTHSVLFSMA